ncbi:MAG TPA: C4-type zinc ribbon domain-containing protein [Acidimicrobiales bacterium]
MSRWEPLLAVQEHDTHVDQLVHRSQTLPVRAEIARHEDAVVDLDARLREVEARHGELTRSQQRLEHEITSLGDKANQAEKRLYSGAVSNPRELQALQDDVASIRRRIGQVEDEELQVMELLEPVEARRVELLAERDRLDEEGARLRTTQAEAEAEIDAELAVVRGERERAAGEVDADLWPEYDRLRARSGGVAIARLVGSTCHGCHLSLPAVEVDRIKRLPRDEVVHCEECGRLLVRD